MIFLIDIETSGLRAHLDRIVEVAVLAVSDDLSTEHGHIVITLAPGDLSTWDPWSIDVHSKSGLLQRCQDEGISVTEAERHLINFVSQFPRGEKRAYLGGSNFHFDRAFFRVHMPTFDELCHHGGHLDAAVLRQMLKNWRPDLPVWVPPIKTHEALADIRGTLEELRFYRKIIAIKTKD